MLSEIKIRVATPEDAQDLLNIYSYYVKNTGITYEYDVPTLEEFRCRISHTLKKYPYLVAQINDKIIGYAYAGVFNSRPGYGWDAEMTVYLDNGSRGHGVGQKLYTLLEEILKEQGFVKVIALITPPEGKDDSRVYNSIHFHEKMGYQLVGRFRNCGYKFGRWFDMSLMDKMIGTPKANMQPVRNFNEVRDRFGL